MDITDCIGLADRLDKAATLWLNYDGGRLQDCLWAAFSSRVIWIPLALAFLFAAVRRGRDWRQMVLLVSGLALTVWLCDQISASFCKPFFMRLRPSHNAEICQMLHYVGGYRGGLYGFVSSHAANAFGVFAFVSLWVRRKAVAAALLLFVICVCYSRIYLGVHYLGDILFGGLLGLAVGRYAYFAVAYIDTWSRKASLLSVINIWRQTLARAFLLASLCLFATQPVCAEAHEETETDSVAADSATEAASAGLSQLTKAAYIGVPLVVGGIVMKGEDTHFRRLRNDYLPRFNRHADDYLQYAPAAVMLGMKAAGVPSRSSWGRMLASSAFSAALMAGVVNTLKTATQVERPDGSNRHSFPSGHTATAFMTATMLAKEYGHVSPWIGIGSYSVASATRLMRMANNKHWLSDVDTGAGIGILTAELGYFLADLIFKDKGMERFPAAETFSRTDKPSFIGLYLGANIPLSGYDIDEQNEFRTSSGSVAGVEGAYFLNPYVGLGGRFTVSNTNIIVNGSEAEDNTFDAVSVSGGAYFSYPLTARWAVGGKLLCGYTHYPALELLRQTVPSRSRISFGSGLSASFRAGGHYSLRLFLDYNLLPSHSRGSGEWMNTLTLGTSFAISL